MRGSRLIKIRILMVLLIMIANLVACDSTSAAADADLIAYENQEAFLNAMASGIQTRLANVDDASHVNDSDEERAIYYKGLVMHELNQIEKYTESVFEDSRFNTLAHFYIDACQMQATATDNIRNTTLYNALWDGGSTIRRGIIATLYEQYELPIDSLTAANYINEENSIVSSQHPIASEDSVDKEATQEKISTTYAITQNDNDVVFLKNNSNEIITVSLTIKLYYEKELVTVKDVLFNNVLPGKTAAANVFVQGTIYDSAEVEYSSVSKGSLMIADKTTVDDLVSFSITKTTNNAIVECRNNGILPSALIYYTVVFYNNGSPVWCSYNIGTIVDMGLSHSEMAEVIEVKVPFDDVQVFVHSLMSVS